MTNLRKCWTLFHESFSKVYSDQKTASYCLSHFKSLKIPVHSNLEVAMITIPLGKERRQAIYCVLLEVMRKKSKNTSPSRPNFLLYVTEGSFNGPSILCLTFYKVEYLYQCSAEWPVFQECYLSIAVITLAAISKLFIKHVILPCIFCQVSSVTLNISLTFPITHWAYTVHGQEHFVTRNFTQSELIWPDYGTSFTIWKAAHNFANAVVCIEL